MSRTSKPKTKAQKKPSLSIGIPYYGQQEGEWWGQLAEHTAKLRDVVDFRGLLLSGAMTADHSRNNIVDAFKKTDTEWLLWIDSDTIVPIGAVPRMLALGKTLVSGIYYGKGDPIPIAYYRNESQAFSPISTKYSWERGEVLPVDITGLGCCLTHRSVYTDIENNFEVVQKRGGGILPILKSRIIGAVTPDGTDDTDGKVVDGQLRIRVNPPSLTKMRWPFFAIEYGVTEDIWFFDLAEAVGHKVWLDTSVECKHLRVKAVTRDDFLEKYGI